MPTVYFLFTYFFSLLDPTVFRKEQEKYVPSFWTTAKTTLEQKIKIRFVSSKHWQQNNYNRTNDRPICTHSHVSGYSRVLHRLTHFNPFVISFQYFPSKKNQRFRSVRTRGTAVSESRREGRSNGMSPRAKTNGGGVRANANSRPSDIAADYWVTGIKIGGTPKTGLGQYTRRCTGA